MTQDTRFKSLVKSLKKGTKKYLVFVCLVFIWVVIDFVTKRYFDSNYVPGDTISDPILGVFQLHLVHNTGAAWGMFNDSTMLLALSSLVVCCGLLVYVIFFMPRSSFLEVIGLALVFAGGIGNALDRFLLGYVVDFIEFSFIDFPVFNIADIGVTCGFVLFLLGLFMRERKITTLEKNIHQDTQKNTQQNSKIKKEDISTQ